MGQTSPQGGETGAGTLSGEQPALRVLAWSLGQPLQLAERAPEPSFPLAAAQESGRGRPGVVVDSAGFFLNVFSFPLF